MKRFLLLQATLAFAVLTAAEEPTNFIRFVEEDESDSLQTAVVSYESPQKVKVDLVGAIHIADKAYFDGLNVRFKGYDAVLYELVGRPLRNGGSPRPRRRREDAVGGPAADDDA